MAGRSRAVSAPAAPTLLQAAAVWGRIGLLSFGGPAAQIALIHNEVVDRRGWMAERRFLDALGFCMLLPGPEAMQLATYCGWLLNGWRGGLVAGLAFVAPGALVILALSTVYALYGSVGTVEALFVGVKAAVLVIVFQALTRVARRALKGWFAYAVALGAFLALFVFALPYPLVVVCAALLGIVRGTEQRDAKPPAPTPSARTGLVIAGWLALWWLPVGLAILASEERLAAIGVFFSKLAVVTFGGAYAVLAYMAQDVAATYGWLTAGEMLDGLGLAETTPGPLILVVEFVGYLAAFREGGLGLAMLGAAMALWVTFAPCFLWIFAAAPFVEWIAGQPRLSGALEAITAAVVGVILNLSLWFALHVLFGDVRRLEAGPAGVWWPDLGTLDAGVLALTLLAAGLAFALSWGVLRVLTATALAGLAFGAIG